MDPNRTFPFRRALMVDPISIPVGLTGQAVAISPAALKAAGVTSFKISNPTPMWVWYRGWNGTAAQMPRLAEMGHFLAPGSTDLNSSQLPDWIAAVAANEPAFPSQDASGNYLYAGQNMRLVMTYGSGV